jgi:hypothetical protein
MVKVKVRTIWKGLVAIRDKYIKQAYEEKVGIQISHGKESIFIPYEEIESKIVTESDKISDNYSNEMHKLIYFRWTVKPPIQTKDERQRMLLGY